MVRLYRDALTRQFQGSCLIECDSTDAVTAAVAAAHDGDTVTMCYKDTDTPFFCVMRVEEWLARKSAMGKKTEEGLLGVGDKRKHTEEV